MICEIIRGLAFVSRVADRAEEIADRAGFACDEAPCFRDSDEKEEEIIVVQAEVVKEPEVTEKPEPAKKEAPAKKASAKKNGPAKKDAPAAKKASEKEEKKEDKK